uniref:Uncharacterized protein n=1 Tax=Ditylenchus dipsaci TaxID=166011 RepID=A0A915CTU3_9BILA
MDQTKKFAIEEKRPIFGYPKTQARLSKEEGGFQTSTDVYFCKYSKPIGRRSLTAKRGMRIRYRNDIFEAYIQTSGGLMIIDCFSIMGLALK